MEVAAGEQHGAAGLRALVVGGLVALLPHPLGLPVPAPAVAVGAGPAQVVGGERAGGAAAHPSRPLCGAPRSAPLPPAPGRGCGRDRAGPRRRNAGPAPDTARKSHNTALLEPQREEHGERPLRCRDAGTERGVAGE